MLLPKLCDTQLRETFEMLSAEEGNLDAATALYFVQGVELEELLVAANAIQNPVAGHRERLG